MVITATEQIDGLEKLVEGRCKRLYLDCLIISRASVKAISAYEFRRWFKKDLGFRISDGTCYPLFKSLAEDGYLVKNGEQTNGRRKKMYSGTPDGWHLLKLKREVEGGFWRNLDDYTSKCTKPDIRTSEMERLVKKKHLIENLDLVILRRTPTYEYRICKEYDLRPGTCYPRLESLVENHFLERVEEIGRVRKRVVYSTTDRGRCFLDLNQRASENLWEIILN